MPVAVLGGREIAENKNKVLAFMNLNSLVPTLTGIGF